MNSIDRNIHKLAAIAYGEASVHNHPLEIGGIAFAVANRCRAWRKKTVDALLKTTTTSYIVAMQGKNARYNLMIAASPERIASDAGMSIALDYAYKAWANEGEAPSNGAFWWDGKDFRTRYRIHPKVLQGFRFGDPSHNAFFCVKESSKPVTLDKKIKDKKTGKEIGREVRGRYTYVWLSTAAHGETIFWRYDPHYLQVTRGKAYR